MTDAAPTRSEGTFRIVNVLGLHARAASKLTRLASSFRCDVTIEKDGQVANAKSIMGVLLLCGSCGSEVTVKAVGDDAERAVSEIGTLIAGKFGEEQ
ncbi:MAG: HPr family phosphocarrier protein [Deltaproteobacteria bacterium]|nr:HPr family phosphocarrier protein [Deltaproteobacteria bacterium]